VSYLSPEDVVTALEAAKERRKMRLQSFREGVQKHNYIIHKNIK
jgi:hypothetical protein